MQTSTWQRAAAALLCLAGFLLVLQVRAYRQVSFGITLPSPRLEDLLVLIRRQQDEDRALRDEVAALQAKQQDILAAEAAGRSLSNAVRDELAGYRIELGLTAVQGPGIDVTLAAEPAQGAVPQAQDLAAMVNELWAAGAEAVSVNGIRVLATDGVVASSGGVRIAGRATAPPYAILAIGDPTVLQEALMVPGGPVEGLRGVGIAVSLASHAHIVLEPSRGVAEFHLARPMAEP